MFISLRDFVSGYVGGGLGLAVGQPMDTVKARFQAGNLSLYQTTIQLYRREGIVGFYRGFFFPLLTTGLNNAVFFGVYGSTMDWLQNDKTREENARARYLNLSIAAMVGSYFQVIFACPVELVKIRQQTEVGHSSALTVLTQIYQKDGPLGIFRGIRPMMWRDVPTGTAYIIVYETLSEMMAASNMERGILGTCLAGGVAGICALVPVVPFDVVQTRIMADTQGRYRGMIHCFQESFKKDGIRGLYQGTSLVAIRAFPTNAAIFLGYEKTRQIFNWIFNTP